MCLWHPTATLITMHLSKARVKLLKKNWTSWRYGISRDGIPQTPGGNGTVRNFFCAVRYGTVERMICGVVVRYGTLFYQYRPSLMGAPFERNRHHTVKLRGMDALIHSISGQEWSATPVLLSISRSLVDIVYSRIEQICIVTAVNSGVESRFNGVHSSLRRNHIMDECHPDH